MLPTAPRPHVPERYRKKIELIVRKPDLSGGDARGALAPCVFCGLPGPDTELRCVSCSGVVPFDVATGARGDREGRAGAHKCRRRVPCRHIQASKTAAVGPPAAGGVRCAPQVHLISRAVAAPKPARPLPWPPAAALQASAWC